MTVDTLEKVTIANYFNIALQHYPILKETVDMYYQLPTEKDTLK